MKLWATPTTNDTPHPQMKITEDGRREPTKGKTSHSLNLADQVHLWPTPSATPRGPSSGRKHNGLQTESKTTGTKFGMTLETAVKFWPTPRAGNPGSRKPGTGGKILAEEAKNSTEAKGQLSPNWVEALMGFPQNWTAV